MVFINCLLYQYPCVNVIIIFQIFDAPVTVVVALKSALETSKKRMRQVRKCTHNSIVKSLKLLLTLHQHLSSPPPRAPKDIVAGYLLCRLVWSFKFFSALLHGQTQIEGGDSELPRQRGLCWLLAI